MGAVQLDAVEAGLLGAAGGRAEVVHEGGDLVDGHVASGALACGAGGGAGRDEVEAKGRLGHDLATGVVHLAEDLGAVGVNGGGQVLVALDLAVVPQAGDARVALTVLLDAVVLGDEQAPASAGLLLHVAKVTLGDGAPEVAVVGDHGGDDKPVRDLARSDFHGREQSVELHYYLQEIVARAYCAHVLCD